MSIVVWAMKKTIGNRNFYARMGRSEIIVRIENVGCTTRYAEFGYPKVFGLVLSCEQAALEVKDSDMIEEEETLTHD